MSPSHSAQVSRKNRRKRLPSRAAYLEFLETRLLMSFAPADVSGAWQYAGMSAQGSVLFNGTGALLEGELHSAQGTIDSPTGTYTIGANGVISIITGGEINSGAMNAAKDLIVVTVPGTGQGQGTRNDLNLLIKHTLTNFSNADINGTWSLFTNGDASDNTGFGSINFNGSGGITGGSNTDTGGTVTITGGSYTVSSTGQVSVVVDSLEPDNITTNTSSFTGWINNSKDTLALNPPDMMTAASDNDTRLLVLVHNAGSYSNADLNTTWEIVGDGYKAAVTFNGAGGFSGAGINTEGAAMSLTGTYSVATGGTFTASIRVSNSLQSNVYTFQGSLSGSRNFGAMGQVPYNNGSDSNADSLILIVNTGALTSARGVAGDWSYAGTDQEGSMIFDDAGNVIGGTLTDPNAATSTPTGTYTLGTNGSVNVVTTTTKAGGINSSGDVMAITQGTVDKTLGVLVSGGVASFSNGDLKGTWTMEFNGADSSSNGAGTVQFDGEGNIDGGTVKTGTATSNVNGGNYTVNQDGTCTVNVDVQGLGTLNFVGAMNASKDVLALSPVDLQAAIISQQTDLSLLVRTSGTYSNADAKGTWLLNTEGGAGAVVLDGSGHISSGTFTSSEGRVSTLSGTYTLSAAGVFAANVLLVSGTDNQHRTFTGAMNAAHNVMIENRVAAGETNNLGVMLSAGNHAPTLTAVSPLNVAVVGHTFAIPYASLLASSNAADLDGDTLGFTIKSLGSGTLLLNGNPATVSATFTTFDTLTWTPPAGTGGTYTAFSVTVTDGATSSTVSVPVAINSIVTGIFSAGDLNGFWNLAGESVQGSVAFDGSGNITGGSTTNDEGETDVPAGTYSFDPSGALTVVDDIQYGALNTTKDVAVISNNDSHSLALLIDSKRGTYTNSNLTGTWFVSFDGAQPSSNGSGTVIFNGAGLITGGTITSGTKKFTITGSYTVNSDGTLNVSVTNTSNSSSIFMHGAIDDSNDIIGLTPNDLAAAASGNDTTLMVLVRSAGAYSNADAKGTWFINGGGTNGFVTLDGAGHISNGQLTSRDNGESVNSVLGGTYTVSSTGGVTINSTVKRNGVTQAFQLVGAMNVNRNMMVSNHVASNSDDNLTIFTSTQDHAPTLKTITPFATAIGTQPFDITFDQLAAAGNEADVDGDALQFQVTTLGAGSFLLNSVTAPATPFLFSSGDTLEWTPLSTAKGNIAAFSVKAFDGILPSTTAVPVVIKTVLPPTVTIGANKPAASETNNGTTTGIGQFTFSRINGDTTQDLVVNYTIAGTADNGVDYNQSAALTGSITIPARQPSITLNIVPFDDAIGEGNETVTLALSADPTYIVNPVLTKNTATVTIADNESVISVAASKPTASELNGQTTAFGQFTITRTGGNLTNPMTVDYDITGTATNGVDYNVISGVVNFTAGQTTAIIKINPASDLLLEGNESVVLTIVPDDVVSPTYVVSPTKSAATVTIADVLPTPAPLTGAMKNTPFDMTYADLLAAIGVTSAQSLPITFKVTGIKSGTLKKNGGAVVVNSTTLTSGDTLTWTPPTNVTGTKPAFSLSVSDGVVTSASLTLSITVT